MAWLNSLLTNFAEAFKWFYILQPWEQALRVRCGKNIRLHAGGLHFKVPYIDFIFKQNTRKRISDVPAQTITTLDNRTITLSGALSYRVADITPLYMKLHMAEATIAQECQAILTEYIGWNEFGKCSPQQVREHVNETLKIEEYGLADIKFILKDFAVVKTYRFITGDMDTYLNHELATDEAEDV
jgi:hypothetical protein